VRRSYSLQLEVLNTLEKNDLAGRYHCVSLQEWFDYRGHVCMAFERLGLSLFDFLKRSGYLPFHVSLVVVQCSCIGRSSLSAETLQCLVSHATCQV
jgi:hypothetical protein